MSEYCFVSISSLKNSFPYDMNVYHLIFNFSSIIKLVLLLLEKGWLTMWFSLSSFSASFVPNWKNPGKNYYVVSGTVSPSLYSFSNEGIFLESESISDGFFYIKDNTVF